MAVHVVATIIVVIHVHNIIHTRYCIVSTMCSGPRLLPQCVMWIQCAAYYNIIIYCSACVSLHRVSVPTTGSEGVRCDQHISSSLLVTSWERRREKPLRDILHHHCNSCRWSSLLIVWCGYNINIAGLPLTADPPQVQPILCIIIIVIIIVYNNVVVHLPFLSYIYSCTWSDPE